MAGLAALAACVALTACGAGEPGTLEVACVPQAEVFVDGTSHGTTPVTIDVAAGSHTVRIVRDRFEAFETTIDIGSGAASSVEAVLVGTDPADTDVVRLLAQASDVAFEEYEDPPRHRGRSKETVARLIWPQDDVRMEGLTSFCIEAGLEYEGDGFIEFKKGRKTLYRVPFSPDYEVSVLTIPAQVRDAIKANDTITWGITFDDRRKGLTTKFKVVKKRQVEKKLAKLEKSRHFRRQPGVTQELLKAQVLHNYSLYTESLVQHLMVHQRHPDSMLPYEGIVKSLRRLDDGDESMLWRETAGFVLGAGRGRRAGTTPASPIPQAPPRVQGPSAPARPDPAVADPGNRPGGFRPGGAPNPSARLALWNPTPALGPGDAAPSGLPGRPDITEPVRPDGVEPETGDTPSVDVSSEAMRARVLEADHSYAEAQATADEASRQAEAARDDADQASVIATEATARHERAMRALEAAEIALPENPSEDAQADLERLRRQAEETRLEADQAAERAEQAQQRVEETRRHADETAGQATALGREAEEARSAAEAAGVTVPQVPVQPGRVAAGLERKRLDVAEATQQAADARHQAQSLEQAASLTGDPELAEKAREAQTRAERLERAADDALLAYREAGGTEPFEGYKEAAPSDETHAEVRALLQENVKTARADLEAAKVEQAAAEKALQDDPELTDPTLQVAVDQAKDKVRLAEERLELRLAQYTQVTGDEPE